MGDLDEGLCCCGVCVSVLTSPIQKLEVASRTPRSHESPTADKYNTIEIIHTRKHAKSHGNTIRVCCGSRRL